ncbi:MAG: hypothetical protein CLLPBCKN_006935 [Chroococcidiopsis cubana SAG 39.79]|uniref:Uncharacterized protein n=1 Tax=Chroococcidiopsis cubana SAG 39.79 TaxID=388085 RepID=A0AB37U8L9_9CYAN|nr:hypothetical protein [Chroococcidiopsis cubana]MDZ4877500.1 hypothetical protein [Chroococcidiopsis cubana SAG 39.79]PSB55889.1 hypothetical protein C7B79_32910 [Chroococcidiopsis cubana CCALA 043]RUS95932.1 hypothetical protein DSM107010_70990 [Chroococcidiopsis cubana SAG 39.79]
MSHIQLSACESLVNTHGNLPEELAQLTLARAYNLIMGDRPTEIPFLVWLLENPASPLALPGKIYLQEHDYLHLLLGRGFSASDEAYVIGFTIGNDMETKQWHLWLYKFVSLLMYPPQFRFTLSDLREFDKGLVRGKRLPIKNLNKLDFTDYQNWQLSRLRIGLGLGRISNSTH